MGLRLRMLPAIAVVEVHGVIGSVVKAPVYSRLFDSIAKSNRYRALLVDIDSPGGSASSSDVLYHSIKKVAEHNPVVASVQGMGASGGYYLACAASKVVALPTALVGSIGVIFLPPHPGEPAGEIGCPVLGLQRRPSQRHDWLLAKSDW